MDLVRAERKGGILFEKKVEKGKRRPSRNTQEACRTMRHARQISPALAFPEADTTGPTP
jgi:hypothetical protein